MAFLLDTHALIWWWTDNPKLPAAVREVMCDPAHAIHVSAATGWEIATKVRSGRMPELKNAVADTNFGEWVTSDGFRHLDVRHDHSVRAGLMPGDHRDPFDRLIAAQALIEHLTVLTCDAAIAGFGCRTDW